MESRLSEFSSENDIFNAFSEYLREKLDDESNEIGGLSLEDYNRELHWQKLDLCFQNVSKECTKLALAYSKPPVPNAKERNSLLESVLLSLDLLWSWFISFPKFEGQTQKLMLRRNVMSIFESVQDLVSSVRAEGCSESPLRLQTTGKVWKNCESFKNIPRDNKAAILLKIDQLYRLISDALAEIEQEINDMDDLSREDNDVNDEETWTTQDKQLFQPCLGLIKAAKGSLKRLKSNINLKGQTISPLYINELDSIADATDKFVVSVDDLVLSLYPPVDSDTVLHHAKCLAAEIKSCITRTRGCHFMEGSESSWLDLVINTVDHNMKNLTNATGNI